MTKEQILTKFKLDIAQDMWFFKLQKSEDEKMVAGVLNKIDEFFEQELSKERERSKKLVEALEEISLLNLSHNETPLDYAIDRKIKQSLTEYSKP